MPSHYSTIGFQLSSDDEFVAMIRKVAPHAVPIETHSGAYLRWSDPSGAELWLQRDRAGEIIGAHPHFAGQSRTPMSIESAVERDDHTELDGAYSGWAHDGLYPLTVDIANVAQFPAALPATGTLQIAGFAYQMWAFDSEEEFASQPGERFASRAFIPGSSIADDGRAEALIVGHVVASGARTNELTGRVFHWAQVESYGGMFDLIADPAVLAKVPNVGGVVKGTFWLTGRVLDLQSA